MQLPIVKYTSCGNNFIVLDETKKEFISEYEKRSFSYYATNQNFGIGSDNLLVVQPCTKTVLEKINAEYNYWSEIPNPNAAEYIFRMFETDGTEAYSCGNGLMSIAHHLFNKYEIKAVKIITEIPTKWPTTIKIGTDIVHRLNWVNMAPPRRVPDNMVDQFFRLPLCNTIDRIDNLTIRNVRQSDKMRFFLNHSTLKMKGYLVFTGEPHLVFFSHNGFEPREVSRQLFINKECKDAQIDTSEKRAVVSNEFVNFIGNYFVREFYDLFPVGINLNFVLIADDRKSLEHRCFERGINHETLACGTGSLASAIVAKELDLIEGNRIIIRPHRCRWTDYQAELVVEKVNENWVLKGHPKLLFEGNYLFE